MDNLYHSVYLQKDLCKGCINCIKRCPTEAIRVRNGKAHIRPEFCIDCGECIRICPHHAKKASFDPLSSINKYEYKVVLPPPSFYAQFNNLEDKALVLDALIAFGFDDVFEVATAAEMVSEMTRMLISQKKVKLPVISSACPSVVRLIRVKFPNLIEHISPLNVPVDLAAHLAAKRAMEKTGLPREKIGIVFITPCPAKVTALKTQKDTDCLVDCEISMSEMYTKLLPFMKEVYEQYNKPGEIKSTQSLSVAGKIGVSWGRSGGEAGGILRDTYLAADGIENVLRVLEDLEDEKLQNLDFIELNACSGGCVGGVLAVENPYLAKVKLNVLRKYLPVSGAHLNNEIPELAYSKEKIEYLPIFNLSGNIEESLELLNRIEQLVQVLPGLDCGCCGAPTCRALAEDIVRGEGSEKDCIFILKRYIHEFSDEINKIR